MNKILILLFTILVSGCISSLDQKNLEYMADLTLCEQQKFNSDQLTLSWGLRAGGRSIDSIESDLKLLSAEINRRGIDCPKILSSTGATDKNSRQPRIVNCFPNQATGGVTCF